MSLASAGSRRLCLIHIQVGYKVITITAFLSLSFVVTFAFVHFRRTYLVSNAKHALTAETRKANAWRIWDFLLYIKKSCVYLRIWYMKRKVEFFVEECRCKSIPVPIIIIKYYFFEKVVITLNSKGCVFY